MWWILRVLLSSAFLLSIVLSIPIAFDVGGREAGLAYSLALFLFYMLYTTIKVVTPEGSRVRWAVAGCLRLSQWFVIPGLLIWAPEPLLGRLGEHRLGRQNHRPRHRPRPAQDVGRLVLRPRRRGRVAGPARLGPVAELLEAPSSSCSRASAASWSYRPPAR